MPKIFSSEDQGSAVFVHILDGICGKQGALPIDRLRGTLRVGWKETMETFVRTFDRLMGQPLVPVMALLALLCAVTAVGSRGRVPVQLGWATLAVISAMTAWVMAFGWRWPR
jgi:hypothetical protein